MLQEKFPLKSFLHYVAREIIPEEFSALCCKRNFPLKIILHDEDDIAREMREMYKPNVFD